jgi:DUF3048 family protein
MKRALVLAAAVLLVASSCGPPRNKKPAAKPSRKPAAHKSPKPVICPLTGKEAPAGLDSERPALAIKVENSVAARPQAGLQEADVVYEELAEGGITRFMAVYHCGDATRAGPVRSARNVDPDILIEYAPALYGYSGANPIVLSKIQATKGIIDLRYGSHAKAYQRVKGRPAPHDLFTSTQALRALSDVTGPPNTNWTFGPLPLPSPSSSSLMTSPPKTAKAVKSPSPLPSPSAAASPSLPPAGSTAFFTFAAEERRYTYDPASMSYLRFQGTKPHLAEDGSQIHVTNVVILKVQVIEGAIRDAAGNFSPEITVIGSGSAFVLRGGVFTSGTWKRSSLTDHTRLIDDSGKPITLLPGNTWIELLPTDQHATVQ